MTGESVQLLVHEQETAFHGVDNKGRKTASDFAERYRWTVGGEGVSESDGRSSVEKVAHQLRRSGTAAGTGECRAFNSALEFHSRQRMFATEVGRIHAH